MLTVQIPAVAMNDDGKIVLMSDEDGQKQTTEPVNKKRKLTLRGTPFSLTCILHKSYILADPTAEEESIMETHVTIVLDTSGQLISLYKPGGPVLAYTSAIQAKGKGTKELLRESKFCYGG
ncbi:PNPase/RNase PH domain superfamily [Sesbania bispinosa]|nr:PNPase/RNase PH domain superfamily [Sesbania bispinosa]